jgi:hypothetical protein
MVGVQLCVLMVQTISMQVNLVRYLPRCIRRRVRRYLRGRIERSNNFHRYFRRFADLSHFQKGQGPS